jgi:hypothetical protein
MSLRRSCHLETVLGAAGSSWIRCKPRRVRGDRTESRRRNWRSDSRDATTAGSNAQSSSFSPVRYAHGSDVAGAIEVGADGRCVIDLIPNIKHTNEALELSRMSLWVC